VSDFFIFCMGCIVTLMVAGAVGLLLWGAAHEPRGNLLPSKQILPNVPTESLDSQSPSRDTQESPQGSGLLSLGRAQG
jgi:hypothetical protein